MVRPTILPTIALVGNRAANKKPTLARSQSLPDNVQLVDNVEMNDAVSNDDIIRAMPISPSNSELPHDFLASGGELEMNFSNASGGETASQQYHSTRQSNMHHHHHRQSESLRHTALESLEELILRNDGSVSPGKCERAVKRKLRFFFMTPVEKWRKRHQFPFKLFLELIKIAVVTFQLCFYGYDRTAHLKFNEMNSDALTHIFLPNYESQLHDKACTNCVDLYRMDQIYASLNDIAVSYYDIENIAVGNYLRDDKTAPLMATLTNLNVSRFYNNYGVFYDLDTRQETIQVFLKLNSTSSAVNMREVNSNRSISINLETFLFMSISFKLNAMAYHRVLVSQKPSCISFFLTMEYDNLVRSGEITQTLKIESIFEKPCHTNILYMSDDAGALFLRYLIIVVVMVLSVASLILCTRSAARSERLRRVTVFYFDKYLNRDFTWKDGGSEFLDLWLYLIIVTDLFLLCGSICWIVLIESSTIDLYEEIALILGIGTLLSWISILRYLNYYQKLSLLLVTLKRAFPNVMRFLLCAMVFFCGFLFFGWIVLGPYSEKFQTISRTAEQLFALINGDDMFATFSSIAYEQSILIWAVSRIYLYSFIALYIYVVLSLFIAIIIDVYEEIKESWKNNKFRPFSPILRQLLLGALTKQSELERQLCYEMVSKQKRQKGRKAGGHSKTGSRQSKLSGVRNFFGRLFGFPLSQPSTSPPPIVKYITSVDTSLYNVSRSRSNSRRSASGVRVSDANAVVIEVNNVSPVGPASSSVDANQQHRQYENEERGTIMTTLSESSSESSTEEDEIGGEETSGVQQQSITETTQHSEAFTSYSIAAPSAANNNRPSVRNVTSSGNLSNISGGGRPNSSNSNHHHYSAGLTSRNSLHNFN